MAFQRELDRVTYEVGQYLPDPVCVAGYKGVLNV